MRGDGNWLVSNAGSQKKRGLCGPHVGYEFWQEREDSNPRPLVLEFCVARHSWSRYIWYGTLLYGMGQGCCICSPILCCPVPESLLAIWSANFIAGANMNSVAWRLPLPCCPVPLRGLCSTFGAIVPPSALRLTARRVRARTEVANGDPIDLGDDEGQLTGQRPK